MASETSSYLLDGETVERRGRLYYQSYSLESAKRLRLTQTFCRPRGPGALGAVVPRVSKLFFELLLATADELLDLDGAVTHVVVRLAPGTRVDTGVERIAAELGGAAVVALIVTTPVAIWLAETGVDLVSSMPEDVPIPFGERFRADFAVGHYLFTVASGVSGRRRSRPT